MHREWQRVSAVAALTLALTGTWVAPTAAKDPPKGTAGPALQAAAIPGLAMGGNPPTEQVPLRIAITPDLNCAVNKFSDQFGEFFGDTACGTLISVNGALFGPASIPAGGSASPKTAFTPVSQTLTGSGTESDAWQITTVVDAGAAARVTEVDRYVAGDVSYQTDVTVRNVSSGSSNVRLYRAADCYLQDSDFGFGRLRPASSVACVAPTTAPDGSRVPGSWVEEWSPISLNGFMFYGFYDNLWATIGRQETFVDGGDSPDSYMDNSAGLSWSFTLPPGGEATNSHVMRITDTLSCGGQQLDHQTPDGRVVVKYDPRFLWSQKDPAFGAHADEVALTVQARAIASLNKYRELGFPVDAMPNPVVINIRCDFPFFIPSGSPGWTESAGTINLRADFIRANLFAYLTKSPRPNAAGTGWANLIDHELAHTLQVQDTGQVSAALRLALGGDYANVEGTATAIEDLIPDTDDLTATEYQSFLGLAKEFLQTRLHQVDQVPNDGRSGYRVAPFFEYLGERFGDQSQPNLELRAAAMLRALYRGWHADGIETAIGRQESAQAALRDFLLTAYVRDAGNRNTLPQSFRILDEVTANGGAPGTGSGLSSWGRLPFPFPDPAPVVTAAAPVSLSSQSLAPYSGQVYQVGLGAGIEGVRVTIADKRPAPTGRGFVATAPLQLAFVPSNGFTGSGLGAVAFDPALRRVGPAANKTQDFAVTVGGNDRLAIVAVTGGQAGTYDLTIAAQVPGLALDTVVPVADQDQGAGIEVLVTPTLDGAAAHGLTARSFTATISGTSATVTSAFEIGTTGHCVLFVKPAAHLAVGSYPITVRFGSSSVQGTVVITANGGGTAGLASVGGSGAIRTRLGLGGEATGGTPIETSFIVTDGGVGLAGLDVVATVTTPTGSVRHIPLADTGTAVDAGADDGAYGAYLYGTNAPGAYSVRVDATGTDRSGAPVSLSLTDTITLGAMTDQNGDGVADSLAGQFGPGAIDADADGATTAAELAVGSNPVDDDTDAGGEIDGTEIAAGRNPMVGDDDLQVAHVAVSAVARDGRLVDVAVGATDATTPVHLYRVLVADGTSTDLGLRAGAGEQLTDGPLAAGTYQYVAVGEAANGARGPAVVASPVEVRDDATAPRVSIYLNNDDFATNQRPLTVTFFDLSETVTAMRIVDSEAELASAAWVPYQTQSTFTLSPGDGPRRVFAQVRDASGLVSGTAIAAILLDTTAPTSAVGALPASTTAASIDLPFTATDALSSVAATEIWARYRASATSPWSSWGVAATATSSPATYGFPFGTGDYEFYSVAIDAAGNRETAPASADATTKFDRTPPATSAGPLAPSYSTPTVAVPFAGSDDLSGVASVELWSRRRATTNDTWTAWTLGPTGMSSPITFTFGANGLYEFYTIGIDVAGNRENPPVVADAATEKAPSTTWSPAVRVNDDSTTTLQVYPEVGLSSNGSAVAVWQDYRNTPSIDVYASRRDPASGAWSPNTRVNDVATGDQYKPAVAMDGNGNAYAVWVDTRNGRSDIYFSKRSASTGAWGANVRVNSVTSFNSQDSPAIAVAPGGDAVAVWYRVVNNKLNVWSARLAAGASTWGAEIRVTSDQALQKQAPAVTFGPDGAAYAVWMQPATGNADIYFSSLASGSSTWTTNMKVSDDPGTAFQSAPDVAVDGSGKVFVTWTDRRATPYQLRVRIRSGGAWQASTVVASDGGEVPSIAARSDGRVYVAWHSGDLLTAYPVLRGSMYIPASGTWATPERIDANDAMHGARNPSVVLDGTRLLVLWDNALSVPSGENNNDIYARQRTP